ncbi:MAG: ECF transporter S component [Clostridia bacterium]|nr:ECF transporter S component [Clostridia bacterium]
MKDNTKKITVAAMFAALAFAVAAMFNVIPITLVPSLPFLHYDPKDVLITLCGFILGPVYSVFVSLIASLIELTISNTGLIGAVMNFLSSCIYACSAALIYKRVRNVYGAVFGLIVSTLATTGFMLLWNWLISPLYMGISREAVSVMLIPAFLPFNLIKGCINAGVTLLIYKPVITVLRNMKLVKSGENKVTASNTAVALIIGIVLILLSVIAVLALK